MVKVQMPWSHCRPHSSLVASMGGHILGISPFSLLSALVVIASEVLCDPTLPVLFALPVIVARAMGVVGA